MSKTVKRYIWIAIHMLIFIIGMLMVTEVLNENHTKTVPLTACIGIILMGISWFILVAQKMEDAEKP